MISGYLCASKISKLGHQISGTVVCIRIYSNDYVLDIYSIDITQY